MHYKIKCLVCGRESLTYRSPSARVPRFCSKSCFQKFSPTWLKHTPYKEKTAEEKENHLRKYFEKRVIRQEGCWDWKTKAKGFNGYIRMDYARDEPRISAHIYSYRTHVGGIPEGMNVCHSCDNPRCTNPEHLFLGTTIDNIKDKIKKKRHPHGDTHGNSSITESQAKRIKKMLAMGISSVRISKDLEVSLHIIYHIKNGKTWKHI